MCLIEDNMKLVYKIAHKYKGKVGMEFDDIVQEGSIGLIEASKRYDGERNFGSYAYRYIQGYILTAADKNNNDISINREAKRIVNKAIKNNDSNLSVEEFSKKYHISLKTAQGIIYYIRRKMIPIDEKIDGELGISEVLGFNEEMDYNILKEELLSKIEGRKREYFEMLIAQYTHREIADRFGLKRASVSEVINRERKRLRSEMNA